MAHLNGIRQRPPRRRADRRRISVVVGLATAVSLALLLPFSLAAADSGQEPRAAALSYPDPLSGRVVKVKDGDSLVISAAGERIEVRLDQIDAPEYDQPWGDRSRRALRAKVQRRTVLIAVSAVDGYGRRVGRVWVDDRDINQEMVAEGQAWVYRRYLSDRSLLAVEATAREAGVGLWSQASPQPPWQWRRR